MKGLESKIVIVTGAGGAIGRAISARFAEQGSVVGVFDKNQKGAADTVELITRAGGRAHPVTCDLTDYQAVDRRVAEFESRAGPIDVLVNCAGWDRLQRFLDSEPALWDQLIAINLRGVLNTSRVVLGGMAERGRGRVVNIASDAGRVGSSGEAVYAACKGGVIAFTKAIAREMAGHQITVNAVCPGPTDTPLFHAFLDEGEYGKKIHAGLARAVPLRRIGKPDDVAGIVVFLASDEASYMTGQVVSVSGGLTMHG
ncbi:MAG: SDR family oxidoreductase [Proteobacteria bacterium]|nr:SDR family oxidoreductase [Pseudomonadota bacterium]